MTQATRAAALALVIGSSACGNDPAPVGLSYTLNPAVYTAGTAITPNLPRVSGGRVATYGIWPALPAGLNLSPSSGVISGTPSNVTAVALYTVTASNSGGQASTVLSITVSQPAAPVIVTQPATQVVAIGQTASFSVVATGTGALTYQWSRDGGELAGETGTSLTTAPVTYLDDDAALVVVVSDSWGGSVASQTARIRLEGFIAGGTMVVGRQNHAASRFGVDGKVLITGGFSTFVLADAEVYDPASGTSTATRDLTTARQNQSSTLLANGKVLLVGGQGAPGGGTPLASAESYDPATATFSATDPMATARFFHTATLLQSGKVLVAGGLWSTTGAALLDTAEVFDPATGTFVPTGAMITARYWHTATPLPDGTVLIAGGYGPAGEPLDSAELYDPVAGTFTATGSMISPRYGHTATWLAAGNQVLVAGGYGASLLDGAELYDVASGGFSATGPLTTARHFQTATALPGGKVLIAGGLTETEPLSSAELYDPVLGSFTPTGSMETERYLDTATLLESGEVLVTGGWTMADAGLASTEIFSGAP